MTLFLQWFAGFAAALLGAPLLPGIINKVKAFYAGRKGPSIFQLYRDIYKLARKKPVYSTTTGAIFRLAPIVVLAAAFGCAALLPFSGVAAPFSFQGDMILFLYLAGLGRVMTVLGAMDTGSSFEGMGASRECQFAIFTEGAILAVFGVLVLTTGHFSLDGALNHITVSDWTGKATALILLVVSFHIIILVETCRVPMDDPDTHLELTMIHEAMILDNSGLDLAFVHYAAALKLWTLLAFGAMMVLPTFGDGFAAFASQTGYVLAGAVATGVVESVMARFRFLKVPQLIAGAFALAMMSAVFILLFQEANVK